MARIVFPGISSAAFGLALSVVLAACGDSGSSGPDVPNPGGDSSADLSAGSSDAGSGGGTSQPGGNPGEPGTSSAVGTSSAAGGGVSYEQGDVPPKADWVAPTCVATGSEIPANDPCVLYFGRWDRATVPESPTASWSGAHIRLKFNGTGISIKMTTNSEQGYLKQIDGGELVKLNVDESASATVPLFSGLAAGEHELTFYRRSEGSFGMFSVQGFVVEGGTIVVPNAPSSRMIECMGNSITAGFAADAPTNSLETNNTITAWCVQTAMKLGAEWSVVAHSGQGMYINLNGTGTQEPNSDHIATMYDEYQWMHFPTWSGVAPHNWQYNSSGNRVPWDWSVIPDVAIYAIGTNDYINPDPSDLAQFNALFKAKYKDFIKNVVRPHYPRERTTIFLHGIVLPDEWTPHHKWDTANRNVEELVAELNSEGDDRVFAINPRPTYSNTDSWLADGNVDFNGDRTHPSAGGHQILATKVSAIVREKMGW